MKKILLLLMVFLLMGCQENKKEESRYKNGTYNVTVNGYGGDFMMSVIIEDDKVSEVMVGENNETPSIGGVAIEQLINQMKERQNDNIEIISGATKTSQAMITAYKEVLENAKNKAE